MISMIHIVLSVLYVANLLMLLIVLGIRPQLSSHSRLELKRQLNGGQAATLFLRRRDLLRDIFSLQRVVAAVLLVLLSVLGVELFHWAVGSFIALVIALESGAVAWLPWWQRFSQRLYGRLEGRIFRFVNKHPFVFRAIRSVAPAPSDGYDIESKEELLAMVAQSGDALASDEKKMVQGILSFDTIPVRDVMTPRSVVDAVATDESLGPLVLDGLHKTGHSRFPVYQGDMDHVVGMLYIQDLFTDIRRTASKQKVADAMSKKVYYIHQDRSLRQALSVFLKTRHHLFIVVNEFRETVGIVSLEDVLERVLGRAIVDEFDAHEDLRKVAASNPRRNNAASGAHNVV